MKLQKHAKWIFILSFFLLAGCEECEIINLGTPDLPDANLHSYYNERIDVVTHCDPKLEDYYLVGGTLPPGISLSSNGQLAGSPTRIGIYSFSVGVEVCFVKDGFNYYECETRAQGFSLIVK